MGQDDMKETYWSRFADTYDLKMEYVVGRELRDDIVRELKTLPDLGNVVELGCGPATYTESIVPTSKSVCATDLSDSLLEVARARIGDHPKVTIQKEHCLATSFSNEAMDTVFMANLIHVVESPDLLLQECCRILRKDGILVLVSFTDHDMKLWEKIKLGLRFARSWGKPPAHTHSFSPEGLGALIVEAGFSIETARVIGSKTKAVFIIGRKR